MSIQYIPLFCCVIFSIIHTKTHIRRIIPQKHTSSALFNLDTLNNPCIVETKQILVPAYPGAFNPCIVQIDDHILLSFRIRDEHMASTFGIGLQWLDTNFNPIGKPYVLRLQPPKRALFTLGQDPRLIICNNQLYILYNNFAKIGGYALRRMVVAPVFFEHGEFITKQPLQLHSFEENSSKPEKNWVPFVYQNSLLLAYSLTPHRIVQPDYISGDCPTIYMTDASIQWKWGELRGGTPAVLLDENEYIAFFHSSKPCATVQSNGKVIVHYVMGAYTFQSKPPFAITRVSPAPLVGPHFYKEPWYNTWKPLRVVFPMGCIMQDDYIWVSYGRQDFEMWIAKIEKEALLKTLVPVAQSN